ncbi:trifunctional purine biosynthetic protein adenosine-3, partial [Clarias magur]
MEVTSSSTAANVAVTDKDGNGGQHKAMLWSIQEAAERYTEQIGVSACGATAVVDVLQALGITVAPKTADRCVQTKLRRNNSPLPDYLHSRSEAGATHVQLIDGAKEASAGRVLGRFFGFYPPRQVNLVQWLAHWIRQRAVPVATMNMQRGVAEGEEIPDAWHHQLIFGVMPNAVFMTNPLDVVSEEELHVRLCSESVLLIRREDVFKRLESDSLLPLISDRKNDPRWKTLNVEAVTLRLCGEPPGLVYLGTKISDACSGCIKSAMAERVLVIGSGGREHALAWKLAQSPHVQQVLVAPGNAGTASCGKISNSAVSVSNHSILAQYCKDHNVGLVVVGPEVPLAAGMVDDLTAAGIMCFGPSAKAAQLESSKSFAKSFMERHGIPTARWSSFTDAQEACAYIREADFPALVVKASGLAAGKGVIVAKDKDEACKAVLDIMKDKTFGVAGDTVVVEELLEGEEVSCLCFSDGFTVAAMPPAQDHKRLLDGDRGPNTGGMGAYCPTPQVPEEMLHQIKTSVLQKTVDGMKEEGVSYVGVLYAGLMLTEQGPKVLEFNCRFGDPECQVLLPLLKSDLYEVLKNTLQAKLASSPPVWLENSAAVTVVMASEGYPGVYKKGVEITGLPQLTDMGLQVFHAGTALKEGGGVVSSGGRVLTVTAVCPTLESALSSANAGVAAVGFPNAVFRRDIGHRAIAYLTRSRGLTYKDSGVDIAAGNKLVDIIKPLAKATSRSGCTADLGGFAGLFDLKAAGFVDPILVAGTDGVGTKLKIAQACGIHSTLGQDLVAMCVNDVLAQGAEPLFFLDYFSCGRLDVGVASSVIRGIAEACQMAGCALLGGETAEMPGVYGAGEYDLAGFCVGAVERDALLPRLGDIQEGDVLIGVASSGVHSNGFSLVRKILERVGLQYSSPAPFGQSGQTVGEVLLTPTKIYSRLLQPILRSGAVKAYAHITGGGLLENIPRVLPKALAVDMDATHWRIPPVFPWLKKEGALSEEEMSRTFNCGLGAVLVVSKQDAQRVLRQVQAQEEAWIVGSITHRLPAAEAVVIRNLEHSLRAGPSPAADSSVARNSSSQTPSSSRKRTKVAVLISGTGTNLQALMEQTKKPSSSAEIVVVISNRPGVLGLKRASMAGIQTRVVDHKLYGSRAEFDSTIDRVLEEFGVELVCLAGFMRILTGPFVRKWNGKLLNIHPSLLPSFKGVNAQKQALQAGVRVSGCSVHFVA